MARHEITFEEEYEGYRTRTTVRVSSSSHDALQTMEAVHAMLNREAQIIREQRSAPAIIPRQQREESA